MIKTKKLILIALLITLLYFLQSYFSVGEYYDELSGSCLDCSVWIDLIFNNVFQLIILILFFLISWRFRMENKWQIIFSSIFLIFWWIFTNNEIFKDRVSGWSTFLTSEEWASTIGSSLFPISVCITIFGVVLPRILNINKK